MSYAVDRTEGGRVSVRDVLFDAERRLQAAGVPSPSVDAAVLVAQVLGVSRSTLILHDPIVPEQRVQIESLITRRLSRVPLQHITGVAHFRHLDLAVGPGVFIPRPETELVAEAAIRALRDAGGGIAVDLCSGSGAVALAMATEVPNAVVYAVEVDDTAVDWTRRNVRDHAEALARVGSRVEVVHDDAAHVADRDHALHDLVEMVNVVAANPPYIPSGMIPREIEVRDYDPAMALFSGSDGLDLTRKLIATAAVLLRSGGLFVTEHADGQGDAAGEMGVPWLLSSARADDHLTQRVNQPIGETLFTTVVDRSDLNGLPRFTMAIRR